MPRTTTEPPPRAARRVPRRRVAAGKVLMQEGDLARAAEATGRSKSHIRRVITGERTSAALRAALETLFGVPLESLEPARVPRPRRRSRRRAPARTPAGSPTTTTATTAEVVLVFT